MKTMDFKVWMKSINRMSRSQRDKLRGRLEGKVGADTVVTLIEQSLNDEPACPYCMSAKLYRWGKVCE
ncbi:MAG: IS1595 family transposase, partial [Methylococcales bacterium]|nr:IS1595 family transposase [Methylococcales bacterium]